MGNNFVLNNSYMVIPVYHTVKIVGPQVPSILIWKHTLNFVIFIIKKIISVNQSTLKTKITLIVSFVNKSCSSKVYNLHSPLSFSVFFHFLYDMIKQKLLINYKRFPRTIHCQSTQLTQENVLSFLPFESSDLLFIMKFNVTVLWT